jgi:uncharacterized membrane protein (UPF0127 family)
MLRLRTSGICLLLCLTAACSDAPRSNGGGQVTNREVTLPDGFKVNAELKVTAGEMARGMMYRESLEAGNGMLFVHAKPGQYGYWMANCKIPLDIIWMDSNHQVVEISANTPPCPSGGSGCPSFGGHFVSQYVLEIGANEAQKHGVREGVTLQF